MNKHFFSLLVVLTPITLQARVITTLDQYPAAMLTEAIKHTLDLSDHNITNLGQNCSNILRPIMDKPSAPITTLNLSKNQIKSLEDGAFHQLTKVEFIDLSNNQIASIASHEKQGTQEAFFSLPSLQWIYLQNNKLTFLHHDSFANLTGLWGLVLSHNQITDMDTDALYHLRLLNVLDLSSNQLTTLKKHMFLYIPTEDRRQGKTIHYRPLKKLNLSYNNITKVEKGCFMGLPYLEQVIVQNNKTPLTQELQEAILQEIAREQEYYDSTSTCTVIFDTGTYVVSLQNN